MEDGYAGDVGDFSKFALLKSLFGCANRTIGVTSFLFPNESQRNDGRYVDNVDQQRFFWLMKVFVSD